MVENFSNKSADRPLECSDCKKPPAVLYTEIVGDQITRMSMCADCPELYRRLHGGGANAPFSLGEGGGLACGNCGTTFESVRMGHPLGCSVCYEIFDEVVFQELVHQAKLPPRLTQFRKSIPVHIGRKPGEAKELNLSAKLLALNEALSETLKAEDYEQAALLRDQIRELTERNPELKMKGNDIQK